MISVDTKKKELVGPFKNNGREWDSRGEPVRVDTHDFPECELGRAVPYGIHDVAANTGWVNLGTDHETLPRRSDPLQTDGLRLRPTATTAPRTPVTNGGCTSALSTGLWLPRTPASPLREPMARAKNALSPKG